MGDILCFVYFFSFVICLVVSTIPQVLVLLLPFEISVKLLNFILHFNIEERKNWYGNFVSQQILIQYHSLIVLDGLLLILIFFHQTNLLYSLCLAHFGVILCGLSFFAVYRKVYTVNLNSY